MADFIEYFEEKGFDHESINYLQTYIMRNYKSVMYDKKHDTNNLKKIKFLFHLLGFIGLDNEAIEKLLVANPSLLSDSKEKILKFAYVWKNIGEYAMTDNSYYRKSDIKRVFLREQYRLNVLTRNYSPISYNCLTMSDAQFIKYYGPKNDAFEPNYETLLTLFFSRQKEFYDKSIKEKEDALNEYLKIKALEWYRLSFTKIRSKHV